MIATFTSSGIKPALHHNVCLLIIAQPENMTVVSSEAIFLVKADAFHVPLSLFAD